MDEVYETKLLYLGDYLFGELHRKNITSLPPPLILEEIQAARVLHCDHNIPELYLEHVQCTALNSGNVNIPENLQTYVSSTDITTILSTPTILDVDYVVEEQVKPDASPNSHYVSSVSETIGVVNVRNVRKTEPAQSESDILQTFAPDCELHMQISNIISLRQDLSPTASSDSTIIGGTETPQVHLLTSSLDTNGDIIGANDESLGASQEVTDNVQQINSTDHSHSIPIESGSQNATDELYQTYSMDVANIRPTDRLSDINILHNVAFQEITVHPQETFPKDTIVTSPIESLADQSTLQDITPVTNWNSQDVTYDIDHCLSKDITDDIQHNTQPSLECRLNQSADWNSNIEPVINIIPEHEADPTMKLPTSDVALDNTINSLSISSRTIANSSYTNSVRQDVTHSSQLDITFDAVSESSKHGLETTPTASNEIILTTEYGDVNTVRTNTTCADIVTIPSPNHTTSRYNAGVDLAPVPYTDEASELQDITSDSIMNRLSNPTHTGSQDITPNTDSEFEHFNNVPLDQESAHAKEICKSLGLPETVYLSNSDTYYPVLIRDHEEIDYIHFKDSIKKSCSIELDNMSSKDIQKELNYLKCQQTSSPNTILTGAISSSEKDYHTTSNEEDVKKDPTYGLPRKRKASKRPKRAPSAARIAAQKLILKTRGAKVVLNSNTQTPDQTRLLRQKKASHANSPVKETPLMTTAGSSNLKGSVTCRPKSTWKGTRPGKKYILKITHHSIAKRPSKKKSRKCQCEMCGETFPSSMPFITHYHVTHPLLHCPGCNKTYNNPLSLQKHSYTHTGEMKQCPDCDKHFLFESQLNDHRKPHLMIKQYMCNHPKCGRDFTHKYNLAKHERTHSSKKWCCADCDYTTKDESNYKQHRCVHTGEKPYSCLKCLATFRFFMQKKRHTC